VKESPETVADLRIAAVAKTKSVDWWTRRSLEGEVQNERRIQSSGSRSLTVTGTRFGRNSAGAVAPYVDRISTPLSPALVYRCPHLVNVSLVE